jgi:hypothetical protein
MSLILKNLVDPNKGGRDDIDTNTNKEDAAGIKYRTLKRDNPKLATRLFCVSHSQDLLLQLGFQMIEMMDDNNNNDHNNNNTMSTSSSSSLLLVMPNPPSSATQEIITNTLLPFLDEKQSSLAAADNHNKKPKLSSTSSSASEDEPQNQLLSSSLSEKQKARRLLQQKQQEEKERAKQARAYTKAQIAADKRVRTQDENWKPAVSAAADKTGKGLLTFRDRHGE